jgi:hypothetical protein
MVTSFAGDLRVLVCWTAAGVMLGTSQYGNCFDSVSRFSESFRLKSEVAQEIQGAKYLMSERKWDIRTWFTYRSDTSQLD